MGGGGGEGEGEGRRGLRGYRLLQCPKIDRRQDTEEEKQDRKYPFFFGFFLCFS